MALEQSLIEICSGLTSIRVNERKKNSETLKDMLSRSAMPSLLTENTRKKSGYTWNQVFNDINEYILKETEKYETNKNFDNIIGTSTSLLNLCVSGSNKGGAHIKCDLIMEACINIFNDIRLRKAIGDAYYSVLYKHVLNNDYYIGFITPSMWENLLEACVNLCLTNSSHMDILTKFKLLWLVIKNASNTVQFVVCLRDSLGDINKCLKKIMDNKKTQDFVMKIFILLVELLSTESRHMICEFTENVLPIIFKFYDHSMDVKKKSLLFKALSVAVTIHHPCGRLKNEEGSLAHDWDVWYKLLHNVLEIVCLEINYIEKSIKQNAVSENFSLLAAITYYQIFNETRDSNDGDESVAKRPKINLNKNKCFNDILKELRHSGPPWVDIVHFYVQQFKHSLTADDYISLIKTSEILIPNMGQDFDNLGEMCCTVIEYYVKNPKNVTYYVNVFYDLWNACVRNATTPATLKSVHMIIRSFLRLDILKYSHVQPLLALYFENGMPVTNCSLITLAFVYSKFYSNCCYSKQRIKCVEWLKQMSITDININYLGNILFRLISDENMVMKFEITSDVPKLYEVFNNMETSILFSNFEYEVENKEFKSAKEDLVAVEFNQEMCTIVLDYLHSKVTELSSKLDSTETLIESVKFIHLTLNLYESLQKYKIISKEFTVNSELYFITIDSLKKLFIHLTRSLRSDEQVRKKIKFIKCLKELLQDNFGCFLNGIARSCIDVNCFHAVNEILKTEVELDDDEDIEIGPVGLKCQCVYFLAAYCYYSHTYTDELVKCILDEDLYKLDAQWDVDCALKCIEMVMDHDQDDKYLESVFGLMKNMCRVLFRNSKASFGLLQLLLKILDRIWVHNDSVMRKNCIIMVKGYYERCNKSYYTPRLASIIYECVARVIKLNRQYRYELEFDTNLIKQIKGNSHSIRIYCCYLLKFLYENLDVEDVKEISNSLLDIFVITVPTGNEIVLKDETINRTLTVLHCFRALSKIRHWLLHTIVFQIIHAQKQKSLNKSLTRKALSLIVKDIAQRNFEEYVNNNILDILYSWFIEGEKFDSLPLNILGFKLDVFLEKHAKWLVASEVLWSCKGHIERSETVKLVAAKSKKTVEDVIEMCFCAIITLCLPYIVVEKYEMESEKHADFKALFENSNRMFHSTRQILDNEKWSNLFVEHLGDLILLAATHVCDPQSAIKQFKLEEMHMKNRFLCSKAVFKGVLRYFGELIDGDVIEYFSGNQPLVILNILFKLWGNFVNENVPDFKILQLHTYVCFIENIKIGFASDAVLFNFILNSLANAINTSVTNELKAIVGILKQILDKLKQANSLEKLRGNISAKILAVLSAKDASLMELNEIDVVDSVVYKSNVSQHKCASKVEFTNMLQTYTTSLIYPSNEILRNFRQFLKTNSDNVNDLCKELNIKGFSEDCSNSLVHCIINGLSNILKTSNENKIVIEACNCLAEMATYDIKTLVTVPPADTERLESLSAKEYFTYKTLETLSSELFDKDPSVNGKVAVVINRILRYRDGKLALDMEGINKEILQPLSPLNSEIHAEYQIDDRKFESFNSPDFWVPKPSEDHLNWVVRITTNLLSLIASGNNCAGVLGAVCALKPTLSAKVMPSILGLLFDCDARSKSEKLIKTLGEQLNQFFTYIWKLTFDDKMENSEDGTCAGVSSKLDHNHKMIIQYILQLIDFIRLQAKNYRIKKSLPLNYLNLDYKKVAWASALADLNLVAIYYGELWAAAQNGGVPPSSPDATSNLDGGSHLQRIFRGCFVSIGEPDAVEGCGTAHLTSEDEKRKHLINTGQFTDSLLLHDIALSGSLDQTLQYGAVTSLHKAGMHHLALQYIKSCPESEPLNDIKYDCLSLLGDWSDFVDTRELEQKSKLTFNTNSITKKFRYACLKDCLNIQTSEDFYTKLEQPLNGAKLAISRLCRRLNMENSQCVYKIMACLHLFRDIESYFAVRCGKFHIKVLLDMWKIEKLPPYKDFKHLESLISQRGLILQHAAENNGLYSEKINSLQLQYAELGLSNQRVQIAQRMVAMVKRFQPSKEVTLLESKVSWDKGHKDIALSLLHDNIVDETDNPKLAAMSLRQYGLWMAECKRENARDIINHYLEKSLEVLKDYDDLDTRNKVYYDIAQFADAEYKLVVTYMNSSTFENKVKCMESMKGTAASLRSSQQTLTRDEKKALIANNAFRQMDEAEIANTRAEKETFLELAMRFYLLSLKQSDDNNLSIFRVISLWFENNLVNLSGLGEALKAVPSWKFITVLPQIAPRLSSDDTSFVHLKEILIRCAKEHPHHTLPILFNLKNSDKDKNHRKDQSQLFRSPPEPRVIAAGELISELERMDPKMAILIKEMDTLYDAIISFAYFTSPFKDIGKQFSLPKEEAISRLCDLNSIPVPTDTIAIKRNCDYSNLSSFSGFDNYFEMVGGINYPKKVNCRSSDGKKRILLIKGEDDMRQDAVMQQVFSIVNTLLEKNPITYHNKLLIRTYKVVALSRRSGVLEWCAGTVPLGTYLTNAHVRHRPQDISPNIARGKIKESQERKLSNKQKLAVFNEILRVFKPVFHYFFTEHYLDPVTWYERRLAYTRSVATSSMVGYILGLGDRHVQNILIDKTTAEVIHIDFGIAFDQGKTLLTPETVPFRLTQDIIAGFGCSGVEGIFRRCCEKTLQLLRDNQETLLTILEVLLCDPLYLWIVPNTSKNPNESRAETASGGLAERALLAVRSKLNGAESGAGGVSVRGQVAALLHRATDRANLCRLFHGWQPYL
ncbi:serine-protein kinase ATM [Pieris napi]|uniref:serine-protein kinase ATM n=1 Tax=Pieris napi TaxID=78633 RepID=UPI001FBB2741|nr:serine-protein kinase ATM [Pieris napi]